MGSCWFPELSAWFEAMSQHILRASASRSQQTSSKKEEMLNYSLPFAQSSIRARDGDGHAEPRCVLSHCLLNPRNKTFLSGWVWNAKYSNDEGQFQIIGCTSASWGAGTAPCATPEL